MQSIFNQIRTFLRSFLLPAVIFVLFILFVIGLTLGKGNITVGSVACFLVLNLVADYRTNNSKIEWPLHCIAAAVLGSLGSSIAAFITVNAMAGLTYLFLFISIIAICNWIDSIHMRKHTRRCWIQANERHLKNITEYSDEILMWQKKHNDLALERVRGNETNAKALLNR